MLVVLILSGASQATTVAANEDPYTTPPTKIRRRSTPENVSEEKTSKVVPTDSKPTTSSEAAKVPEVPDTQVDQPEATQMLGEEAVANADEQPREAAREPDQTTETNTVNEAPKTSTPAEDEAKMDIPKNAPQESRPTSAKAPKPAQEPQMPKAKPANNPKAKGIAPKTMIKKEEPETTHTTPATPTSVKQQRQAVLAHADNMLRANTDQQLASTPSPPDDTSRNNVLQQRGKEVANEEDEEEDDQEGMEEEDWDEDVEEEGEVENEDNDHEDDDADNDVDKANEKEQEGSNKPPAKKTKPADREKVDRKTEERKDNDEKASVPKRRRAKTAQEKANHARFMRFSRSIHSVLARLI